MKKNILFIALLLMVNFAWAQDDLLDMLKDENTVSSPVLATFKGTRIITGQSNENISKKHLNFLILHRFGELKDDAWYYSLLGIDAATVRIALDYGITDKLMVGIGRSSVAKIYDFNVKYKLFQQTSGGKKNFPFTISYYGNMGINTTTFADLTRDNYYTSRLNFCNQLIIARKINQSISLQITPTFVHRNLVAKTSDPNDVIALGLGGSFKVTRSTRFNIEYYPRLTGRDEMIPNTTNKFEDYLAVGVDIETGGHVFQLMFSNSTYMYEQGFVAQTTGKWSDFGVRLGFNLSRTFSFDDEHKK
ncbi:MAG: DUF5777 family beta-barrel protein [Bacteroidia bacterium]|nr:DUF5777 family beta-barrel protein [Bacteroidia bacterium]